MDIWSGACLDMNWFILFESMIINHRHHNLEVGLSITRWQEGCFSSSDKGGSSISPSALSTISISNWYQYQYRHQLSAQFPLSHKTKNWSPGSLLVVPPLPPPLCNNIGVILLRCVFYSLGRIEVGYSSAFQSATKKELFPYWQIRNKSNLIRNFSAQPKFDNIPFKIEIAFFFLLLNK